MTKFKLFEEFHATRYPINIVQFGEAEAALKGKKGIAVMGVGGDLAIMIDEVVDDLYGNHIINTDKADDLFSEYYAVDTDGKADLFLVFRDEPATKIEEGKLIFWLKEFGDASTIQDYFGTPNNEYSAKPETNENHIPVKKIEDFQTWLMNEATENLGPKKLRKDKEDAEAKLKELKADKANKDKNEQAIKDLEEKIDSLKTKEEKAKEKEEAEKAEAEKTDKNKKK